MDSKNTYPVNFVQMSDASHNIDSAITKTYVHECLNQHLQAILRTQENFLKEVKQLISNKGKYNILVWIWLPTV